MKKRQAKLSHTRIKSSFVDSIRANSILRHSTNLSVASWATTSLKPTLSKTYFNEINRNKN